MLGQAQGAGAHGQRSARTTIRDAVLGRKQDALRRAVAWAIVSLIFCRFVLSSLSSREQWIAFVPDDAYYYLGFGRGFASTGHWTLDGGVSCSSGFHLLQAYLAAACWAACHRISADAPVRALLLLSSVFNALSALVCLRFLTRLFGPWASLAVLLVFTSKNALICGMSGMEWSLAVLSLALAAELALSSNSGAKHRNAHGVVLGLFAVISRSDNLLWVFVAIGAGLLTLGWRHSYRLAALGCGALLGSFVIALHSYVITGSWIQDSVLAKLHWGAHRGLDLANSLNTFGMATGVSFLGKGIDCFVLVGLVLWGVFRAYFESGARRAALLLASFTIVAALVSGAGNSGGLQYWYTAAVVLPCCILWASLIAPICALRLGVRGAPLIGVLASLSANIASARLGPWQNQPALLHAALRLQTEDWSAWRVGAWNAGILAYYRGHDVINLDGLANHDALIASQRGKLREYLADTRVRYIVDFAAMVERREYRERGGYGQPGQTLPLLQVACAPANDPRWADTPLEYWRVERDEAESD